MNIQSFLILAVIVVVFVFTFRYVVRKNKRNPGCGSCHGCDMGQHCRESRHH
ncbi:MAG: FeoB-associated Cys-rich membrane protein [Bacteroidales bacterium]|nr:FeoB-associated Cys-rich membrane protein [Bacteroidales bacterium]